MTPAEALLVLTFAIACAAKLVLLACWLDLNAEGRRSDQAHATSTDEHRHEFRANREDMEAGYWRCRCGMSFHMGKLARVGYICISGALVLSAKARHWLWVAAYCAPIFPLWIHAHVRDFLRFLVGGRN